MTAIRRPSLFPALNWNTDELSCAIGIASLRRLTDTWCGASPSFRAASLLAEMDLLFRLHDWTPQDSPFILPVYVDLARATRGKRETCRGGACRGIELNPH